MSGSESDHSASSAGGEPPIRGRPVCGECGSLITAEECEICSFEKTTKAEPDAWRFDIGRIERNEDGGLEIGELNQHHTGFDPRDSVKSNDLAPLKNVEPLYSADTIQETVDRVEERAKQHPDEYGFRKPTGEIFKELKEVFDSE